MSRASEVYLQIGSVREFSQAEGPGLRFAIWTQGCSIKCKGCFNPHFWSSKGGQQISVADLVEQISLAKERRPELEGITLLGGEPFDQPESLASLVQEVKSLGLTVMIFTGLTLKVLKNTRHEKFVYRRRILESTDLLIDGPFLENKIDGLRPWIGSLNQKYHFLTSIYNKESLRQQNNRLEIRVQPDGVVKINGWARFDQLESLTEYL